MSIADVKSLRNQNRFEEAYKMSKQDLQINPNDLWLKRSHAWSLYYMIKKHVQAGEEEVSKKYLSEFDLLEIPQEDQLIHERISYFKNTISENYVASKKLILEGKFTDAFDLHAGGDNVKSEQLAWALYYLLRYHIKVKNQDQYELINRLKIFYSKVVPQKQLVFKLILQELIRLPLDYWDKVSLTKYLEYLGLFEVLDQEDYEKQEFEGKKLISLAERLHIAYAKALIREQASHDKVSKYLEEVVEGKLEKRRGMLYVPYFKAKLLLEIGNREQGMEAFVPFAKRKQGEFWVWQVFAEYYQEDPNLYLSCLCRAMTCKTLPQFLSGIKERLIAHLISIGDYDWAKTELIQLLHIRDKQGWGIRTSHKNQLESSWYAESKEISLKNKYTEYSEAAEQLINPQKERPKFEEIAIVVDHINDDKKIFSFIAIDKKSGFGNYSIKPKLGQGYMLKGSKTNSGFYQIQSLKEIENLNEIDRIRKYFSGIVILPKDKDFGFVEGVFLNPRWIKEYGIKNGDILSGITVLAPVKGKSDWAWKVIKIEK
jgi:hypothetical protein